MNYLLHISIGPVQEFIADARKVKDLWIGSQLLSHMTRAALEPFRTDKRCEVILPSATHITQNKGTEYACLPNRALILVHCNDEETLRSLVKKSKDKVKKLRLEDGVKDVWQEMTDSLKQMLKAGTFSEDAHLNLWEVQCDDLWEYMWVAIEITDDELFNQYGTKAAEIQKALEERKLTRTFKQVEKSSHAFKCTQCGKREMLGPEATGDSTRFWKEAHSKNPAQIRSGDRLCAICLVKRFIDEQEVFDLKEPMRFQSTADVAVMSYKSELKNRLTDRDLREFLNDAWILLEALGQDHPTLENIPGRFFYSEELTSPKLIKEFLPRNEEETKDKLEEPIVGKNKNPIENFKARLEYVRDHYHIEPCKYYALLALDGDEMGKFLSHLPKGKEEQKKKSALLGEVSNRLPPLLKEKGWIPVYSGGDDLLAMGPLEDAIEIACEIRGRFAETFKLNGNEYDVRTSAGLVITHYHNSLRKSLEMLRENVDKAKKDYNRDSLVMSVWVGSGSIFTAGHKWDNLKDVFDPFLDWLDKGLSPAFIYDVLSELDAFYDESDFESEMFKVEARRLFKRHLDDKDKYNDKADDLLKQLIVIANPDVFPRHMKVEEVKMNFANVLRTVAFLHRQKVRKE